MTKDKKQRYTFYCDWPGCPGVHESENSRCDAPVPAPAEPSQEVESRSSLKRKAVMRGEKMPTFAAEPVAGETDEPDLCSSTHKGYVCTNYQGHAGDHFTQGMPGKILHRWPNPVPSVTVPEGEAKPKCANIPSAARETDGWENEANIWRERAARAFWYLSLIAKQPTKEDIKYIPQAGAAMANIAIQACLELHVSGMIEHSKFGICPQHGKVEIPSEWSTCFCNRPLCGTVSTPELASQIVEAVNAGGVSTAGMTAEEAFGWAWRAAHVLAEKGKR